MKYEVDISVFHSVMDNGNQYYHVYINGTEIDWWFVGGYMSLSNIKILNSLIGSNFTYQQLQQYLIENHLVRLYEPPQLIDKGEAR